MKTRSVTPWGVAVGVLVFSTWTLAHHSQSIFDLQNSTNVTGMVTGFEWSNPHVVIYLDVRNDNGRVEKWLISSRAPNMLRRIKTSGSGTSPARR